MKRFGFVLLFAVASLPLGARAESGRALADVCGRLVGSQVSQCYAAAAGRFVDPGAARACADLIGTQSIQCVSAIAGKDYDEGEEQSCSALIGTQVVECLRTTGRAHVVAVAPPPPLPAPPSYRRDDGPPRRGPLSTIEIRSEIAAALESLRSNDSAGTERRLRRLLNDLR